MRGGIHWSDSMRWSTGGGWGGSGWGGGGGWGGVGEDDSVTTYSPSFRLKQMPFVYVPVLTTFRKPCLSSLNLTSQMVRGRDAV